MKSDSHLLHKDSIAPRRVSSSAAHNPPKSVLLFWLMVALFHLFSTTNARAQAAYGPNELSYGGTVYVWYGDNFYNSDWGVNYNTIGPFTIDQNCSVRDNAGNIIGFYNTSDFSFSVGDIFATTNGVRIRPPAPQYLIATDSAITSPEAYTLMGVNFTGSNINFTEELNYSNGGADIITIHRNWFYGGLSGDISGYVSGQYFTGTYFGNFEAATVAAATLSDPSIIISFPATISSPARKGPPYISWGGLLLSYASTDLSGKDFYADIFNSAQVVIDNGLTTSGTRPEGGISGSYDAATGMFNVNADNFFAMDVNRDPIGLPTGVIIYCGYSGFGNSALIATNSSVQNITPNYTYQRGNGTWAAEYVGLSANHLFLVSDNAGNYNSQIYATTDTSGQSQVINAVSGWPATNIYPTQLYINGILCTKLAGSQYDSGAGLPRTGGVSYRASAYDLTVVLSWSWDTQFNGYVTGKYGQSSSFKGNWDGLSAFTNMTAGAIVTLAPLSNGPATGHPPQVAINGTAFTYDAAASTTNGMDTYLGALGQSLTINGAGVATFHGTNGTTLTGTYNSTTHQFNFGAGNVIDLGSGNSGVVTATDTSGHNLATASGGSGGGGVTELAGSLDVHGNAFSLGTWTSGTGENLYGFGLSYADSPTGQSLLGLSTSRAAVKWLWIHPSTDGGSDQVAAMALDSAHRILLYDPAHPANAGVILDPVNGSGFHGPLRVSQQGDISMGTFTTGPTPP